MNNNRVLFIIVDSYRRRLIVCPKNDYNPNYNTHHSPGTTLSYCHAHRRIWQDRPVKRFYAPRTNDLRTRSAESVMRHHLFAPLYERNVVRAVEDQRSGVSVRDES